MRKKHLKMGGLALVILLACGGAGALDFTLIDSAESAANINGGQLVNDAKEGQHAVALDVTPGKTGFYRLNIAATGVDLDKFQGVAFWWKAEGKGLTSFMIKVRTPGREKGTECVYTVWRRGAEEAPGAWTPVCINLAGDHMAWGDPDPTKRSFEFRTEALPDAKVRILVDQIIALPGAIRCEAGEPRLDGGKWVTPVRFSVDGPSPLTVQYGAGDSPQGELKVAPGKSEERLVALPLDAGVLEKMKPLESSEASVWAQVVGADVTRNTQTVRVYKPIVLPEHPRLLVDAKQVEETKARIAKHEWAKTGWKKILDNADKTLAKAVELPPRGGNTSHNYANPKTGSPLTSGKQLGPWKWEHKDKLTGEILLGDPSKDKTDLDGCKIESIHNEWSRGVRDLGLAYRITGEAKYAQKAREVLMAYGAKYLTYPRARYGQSEKNKGRVTIAYLQESMWLIPMAQGADMVWDVLSDAERATLRDKMFVPAVRECILSTRCGIHNIQCWDNSAAGLVGLLFDIPELVHRAIYDPAEGYMVQMEKGILPDGMWFEGSWGYHFFTIMGTTPLTEAARHCGIDLYNDQFKKLYTAPLKFTMPDLRLPNFNDSGYVSVKGSAWYYELACARWDDPLLRSMLAYSNRQSQDAVLNGIEQAGEAPPIRFEQVNFESTGYAILASGSGDQATWLCLKYGPYGGWHGHPDKLTFILYGRGKVISPDCGCVRYGLPIQDDWYKTSLSHNTLIVDETSHPNKATGKCRAFGAEGGVQYVVADAGDSIPGVSFVRTATLVNAGLIVGVDMVRADKEHLLDIAYHQTGKWDGLPQGTAWKAPEKTAYRNLREGTVRSGDTGFVAATQAAANLRVAMAFTPLAGGEVITATGVGENIEDRVPVAILRRKGNEMTLGWAIALDGQAPSLQIEPLAGADGKPMPQWKGALLTVTPAGGAAQRFVVNPDGVEVRSSGGETIRSLFGVAR